MYLGPKWWQKNVSGIVNFFTNLHLFAALLIITPIKLVKPRANLVLFGSKLHFHAPYFLEDIHPFQREKFNLIMKIYKIENNSAPSETISPHCAWCSAFRLEHARFRYLTAAVLFSHAFYSLESVKWPVVILTLIWTLFFSYLCT